MNRRPFLKLGVVLGAALALPRFPLRLASALPLPFPHTFISNPDAALDLRDWDALLVPAYRAAEWIGRGTLAPLAGPPGRAHDPEGAFTHPYQFRIHQSAPLDWPRLAVGLALQHLGHSPNDTHLGHVAQARGVLQQRAPLNSAGVLVEYDWVLTHSALAQSFLAAQECAPTPSASSIPPLLPWPAWVREAILSLF